MRRKKETLTADESVLIHDKCSLGRPTFSKGWVVEWLLILFIGETENGEKKGVNFSPFFTLLEASCGLPKNKESFSGFRKREGGKKNVLFFYLCH